jgi:hypothetical protein
VFLLGTSTCIYARKQNERVLRRLLSTPREEVMVRARSLTLISNHEREFRRVAGLKVENWSR